MRNTHGSKRRRGKGVVVHRLPDKLRKEIPVRGGRKMTDAERIRGYEKCVKCGTYTRSVDSRGVPECENCKIYGAPSEELLEQWRQEAREIKQRRVTEKEKNK
jgi:hypothetical protein